MTKYLLAVVAVVGFSAVGCGGNDCDKLADDLAAKADECGLSSGSGSATESSTETECTDAAATQAKKLSGCLENVTCDGLTGKDTENAAAYAKCVTE